ncbi:polyprenyl glycosylphosphotransferase [Microbacterium sp. CSI-V]|uniref:sugar transferase n=1 Tax=unclassified Microbacterium TaxID=2609290 RepID=UPI00097C92CD|nr:MULTISPECIES: sugar transferase [unclassified Microbacterium]MXS76087.1 sugar transferase [Microbacterium sp. TL13]ONI66567.1 polyprenyl glycosylphosphotransferase [Microbacterium sp. CSI-V]
MDLATSSLVSPAPAKSFTPTRTQRRRTWQSRYARLLVASDALVVAAAVFGTQALWLGPDHAGVSAVPIDYTTVSLLLCVAWLIALTLWGTRLPRVVGHGVAEHRLVIAASFQLFGLIAMGAYLTGVDLSRGYFLLSLPVGTLTLLASRSAARAWLVARRRRGELSARVVLVGSSEENARVAGEIARQPGVGLTIVGVHTVEGAGENSWTDAHARRLERRLDELDADSVLVTGGGHIDAHDIRRIGWGLEPGRQHLIVAVNLTDVAGPRIHTRPVAGLPLVHVETPQYSTRQRVLKRAFDFVGSLLLLGALSPLLLVLAVLVRLSGPGPILYRQERVGQGGVRFGMIKFRSMVDGADARLSELLTSQGRDGAPLFKIDDDPRITPIGRILRRYSLDEIPQLFNVLAGQMSLVGPRPQRDAEVAFYDDDARRRLIVRPGMSGLWQVSGRSALSWEDAIRLDLFYVENWSLIGDLVILFRTVKAVFAPGDTAH